MAEIYEHALLRAPMDIVCPRCQGRAVFTTRHNKALPVTVKKADGTVSPNNQDGQVRCTACHHVAAHTLDWPGQAWFRIEYKGQILWAKDAEMMAEIRRFIAAGVDRNAIGKASVWWRYLLRIPSHFLGAQARTAVLRKIDKLLA